MKKIENENDFDFDALDDEDFNPASKPAPKPAPAVTSQTTKMPTYSNKDVSRILKERESPDAVQAAIDNNATLRNFLQHNDMDIHQKTLKQMPGSEMGPYLASEGEGREGLDIFMEGYPTAEDLEKALNKHKITPREKEVNSYVQEQLALGKDIEKDPYLQSIGAPKDDTLRDVNPKKIDAGLKSRNAELANKAIDKVLNANKKMSEYANTDILKSNGIKVETMTPVATEDEYEVNFDMEGLLGNKEEAETYYNKLKNAISDLGLSDSVMSIGINPATGKGKIRIRQTDL